MKSFSKERNYCTDRSPSTLKKKQNKQTRKLNSPEKKKTKKNRREVLEEVAAGLTLYLIFISLSF